MGQLDSPEPFLDQPAESHLAPVLDDELFADREQNAGADPPLGRSTKTDRGLRNGVSRPAGGLGGST